MIPNIPTYTTWPHFGSNRIYLLQKWINDCDSDWRNPFEEIHCDCSTITILQNDISLFQSARFGKIIKIIINKSREIRKVYNTECQEEWWWCVRFANMWPGYFVSHWPNYVFQMNPTSSLILKGQTQRLYHKHCVCYDFRRVSKQNKNAWLLQCTSNTG